MKVTTVTTATKTRGEIVYVHCCLLWFPLILVLVRKGCASRSSSDKRQQLMRKMPPYEDSVDSNDGGNAIIREMPPYEA
ncbi:hypothetical protein Nepgr_000546 [Nepenthes gracilis]|uniref:Uncharacterized protein n=1 Tax=Nepenthes gracilis TaxID=150966 RepID=A0AAD3P3Z1_NEPGR|nr:hypothetical protein Nepgr_000546 [Nepenthes gracilis]